MHLTAHDIIQLQHQVAYARDEGAYKKLFLHFYPSLLRFAESFVRSNESAEDIVSDVMMKVWDMGSRLSQVAQLKTYLFTAVKNAALDYLSAQKNRHVSIDIIDEPRFSTNPEETFLQSELQQQLQHVVTSLPSKCRLVYTLIKEEGFRYKETADILGISANTVEGHMQNALRKINTALAFYLRQRS